jgi:hypothetical protein
MLYTFERLTDLNNSEATKLLKKLYAALEKIQSDEEISQVKQDLGINDALFDDLVELMILKGWLEMAQ